MQFIIKYLEEKVNLLVNFLFKIIKKGNYLGLGFVGGFNIFKCQLSQLFLVRNGRFEKYIFVFIY